MSVLKALVLIVWAMLECWAVFNPEMKTTLRNVWAESECNGRINSVIDGVAEDDWNERGFGDCSKGSDGFVEISLPEPMFVEWVRIYTPAQSHLRNDLYEMKVCGQGLCQGCDPIPETHGGEWSEFMCNAVGGRAILMKKADIQFQLSEIEIYGFGSPVDIDRIESDKPCAGHVKYLINDRANQSYVDYGFSDCDESLDGTVNFFLSEKQKVDYVRIATPTDGHMRNDYYQLAVCDNDTCTDCGVTPRSNQGEWSLVKCDLMGDQVVLRKVVASVFQLVEVDIHGYNGNNQNYKLQVCSGKESDVTKCPECEAIPRAKRGEWSIAKCGIVGHRVLLTKAIETEFELIEIDILGYPTSSEESTTGTTETTSTSSQDSTTETAEVCEGMMCVSYYTNKYSCTPLDYICDGYWDCVDFSDEDKDTCEQRCTSHFCSMADWGDTEYCLYDTLVCDGVSQCEDGSDETSCGNSGGDYYGYEYENEYKYEYEYDRRDEYGYNYFGGSDSGGNGSDTGISGEDSKNSSNGNGGTFLSISLFYVFVSIRQFLN